MKTHANPDVLGNCQRPQASSSATWLAGQRRKGTRTVWVAVREARDADGWRVIIARDENSRDETDFGITEWQSMPLAS